MEYLIFLVIVKYSSKDNFLIKQLNNLLNLNYYILYSNKISIVNYNMNIKSLFNKSNEIKKIINCNMNYNYKYMHGLTYDN